jgi:Flp pilus assembly protein TadG
VALVEFAIVMPVLFMIVFGMLTGGIVMNRQMSLTHATREAARYGATVPVSQYSGNTWAQHVRGVAVDRSGGELLVSHVCVSLVVDDDPPLSTTRGDGAACMDDGASGRRVQVVAELPGQEINGIIMRVPLTLRSDATSKHEGRG